MINSVPHVEYTLKFEKGKKMPMYMFYCLLGNEYEFRREEPDFHENNDYALDCLHTLVNGYPHHNHIYNDDVRSFTVHYGNGDNTKVAHVSFYFTDVDKLCANIQRGTLVKHDNSTETVYEPGFVCSWDYDTLADYDLINEFSLEDMDDYI